MCSSDLKDVEPRVFVAALAEYFKKSGKVELPEWHDLVKTACYKEMCPQDPDWYFVRCAAVARKVYLRGGTGVGGLQKTYGGRYRNGTNKRHFRKAASGVNRTVMKALEEAGILGQKDEKKGRWCTQKGQQELDTIAAQVVASLAGTAVEEEDEEEADE